MREHDLSTAQWRKSSYSDTNNGNCVEIGYAFPGAAAWRKSTYSDTDNGNCVEVLDDIPGVVPVRDSKTPSGPVLVIAAPAWQTFVNDLRG
ncbi:DUF397 domain-containing protein [Streptomyces jumonjinensis]|uniref:DUF397 domain-containing protein n=1 Tax=Streptomyces jumonjinensis TaxID=1945 RepID=UPI00379628C0